MATNLAPHVGDPTNLLLKKLVTATQSISGGGGGDAGTLTGNTLAANVVNASINNITPAGGVLSVGGKIVAPASILAFASLQLPHGVAPSVPADGDMWTTTGGLFVRINGVTVGPLGIPGSPGVTSIAGTANEIALSAATGAVVVSLPAALTFTGKTVTGGTFNSGAFNGTVGATTPSTGAFTTVNTSALLTVNFNSAALPAGPTGTIVEFGGANATSPRVNLDAFGGVPIFEGRRANGTNALKSAVLSADVLTSFAAFGYRATGYSTGSAGQLYFAATENWTDTAIGTRAVIAVCPIGSTTQNIAFVFDQNGIAATGGITSTAINVIDLGTGALPALANPSTQLRLAQANGSSNGIEAISYASTAFQFYGRGLDGTRAAPAATVASRNMFDFIALGYTNAITTSPSARYRIRAKTQWTATNSDTEHVWSATPTGSLVQADVMTLDAVGINLTGNITETFPGSVNGINLLEPAITNNVAFISFRNNAGTAIGSITRVGVTNAVAYNTTSDARMKEDVRDFTSVESGPLLDSLQPRRFRWKNNGAESIGFLAQEEAAASEIFVQIGAVTMGDDDPTEIASQWQRYDAALIPIMVAEIKALRSRVHSLENLLLN